MKPYQKTGYILLLTFILIFPFQISFTTDAPASNKSDVTTVKGQVLSFADPAQSKTISVSIAGKGIMVFRYDDQTVFSNVSSITELESSAAKITYKTEGPDHIATLITKAYVKIPSGVKEIRTGEVAALIQKGPAKGNYELIDARPDKRYGEGHIPTAISIPVAKLKKQGEKMLPANKNKHLVFYCGGPT